MHGSGTDHGQTSRGVCPLPGDPQGALRGGFKGEEQGSEDRPGGDGRADPGGGGVRGLAVCLGAPLQGGGHRRERSLPAVGLQRHGGGDAGRGGGADGRLPEIHTVLRLRPVRELQRGQHAEHPEYDYIERG